MERACSTHERGDECVHSFSGRTRRKESLGRPRCRWKDTIIMDLREIGWRECGWDIWLIWVQDRGQWQALVNMVMNLQAP
jgi:hypothetical protein